MSDQDQVVDQEPEHFYKVNDDHKVRGEHAFTLTYQSKLDGEVGGSFLSKRMTLGDMSRWGVERAILDQGLALDPSTHSLHNMLAYLKVVLVKTPPNWKPMEFLDIWSLALVYRRCQQWEASFRK